MDLEAVQLLNLSPIPELSELELSTMLEQLSGLSDLNGDLTDRNVEDILKEAENLIDTSMSSKINELPTSEAVVEQEKQVECLSLNPQEINEAQESLSDAKHSSSPVENLTPKHSPAETHAISKHYNSPDDQSNKIFSPGGSSNHIKSTIDSLKEFSTLVEKQLSSRSLKSPAENQNCEEEENHSNKSIERVTSSKAFVKNMKQKTSVTVGKKSEKKGNRLLNCFERLYQERPNRLSKKQKVTDKEPETMIKKKYAKDLKSQGKINWSNLEESKKNIFRVNESISEISLPKHYLEVENWLKNNNSKNFIPSGYVYDTLPKRIEDDLENELAFNKLKSPVTDFKRDSSSNISSQIDEKLILKLLQGMEEIKDHVKNASASRNEVPEKIMQESQAVIDSLRSEVESVREKVAVESMKNAGIKRLEEQFSVLKEKYDQHIKKLEEENLKLREAFSEKRNAKTGSASNVDATMESNKFPAPAVQSSRDSKIFRSFSLENCRAPGNSPCSSLEDVRPSARKEAFSQTEKEVRSTSAQCSEEAKAAAFEEVTIEEEEDAKKAENKENVAHGKRPGKERPFSERNAQLTKQKKTASSHESQLLATIRGLQAELTAKEKENRKLRTEMDLLKSQVKKSGKKGEGCRRRHIGTQTIGLGPAAQKPYDPEAFEVPGEWEKEKEGLKWKIKALEEDLELLKDKRVNDLQSLHQVHEEEMGKLLSKLETQSALTKHLHSMLVNR